MIRYIPKESYMLQFEVASSQLNFTVVIVTSWVGSSRQLSWNYVATKSL